MNCKRQHILLFFFILISGTCLHFTYKWSGYNNFVAYFSAINESPWEHLKLIFWPAVFFCIYEFFAYGKKRDDFFAVKMVAIVSSLMFVLTFFYTYSGILGFNLFLLDILDFVTADFLCCYISYAILNSSILGDKSDSVKGFSVLLFIAFCFIVWTNNPPDLGVFWG